MPEILKKARDTKPRRETGSKSPAEIERDAIIKSVRARRPHELFAHVRTWNGNGHRADASRLLEAMQSLNLSLDERHQFDELCILIGLPQSTRRPAPPSGRARA